jgi:hypothetical protein
MMMRVALALSIALTTGCGTSMIEVTPSQLSRSSQLPEPSVRIVTRDHDVELTNAVATGCETEMSECRLVGTVAGRRKEVDLSLPARKRGQMGAIFAERRAPAGEGPGKVLGWTLFGFSLAALIVGAFAEGFVNRQP